MLELKKKMEILIIDCWSSGKQLLKETSLSKLNFGKIPYDWPANYKVAALLQNTHKVTLLSPPEFKYTLERIGFS